MSKFRQLFPSCTIELHLTVVGGAGGVIGVVTSSVVVTPGVVGSGDVVLAIVVVVVARSTHVASIQSWVAASQQVYPPIVLWHCMVAPKPHLGKTKSAHSLTSTHLP